MYIFYNITECFGKNARITGINHAVHAWFLHPHTALFNACDKRAGGFARTCGQSEAAFFTIFTISG
jgi:hypothetical protein